MFFKLNYLILLTAYLTLLSNRQALELGRNHELSATQNSTYRQPNLTFIVQTTSTRKCNIEAEPLLQQSSQFFQNNKYIEALESYQQVLAICQKIGDRKGIADTSYQIGLVYAKLNNYTRSLQYFEQSLILSKEIGDKIILGETLNEMAMIYYYQGQYYKALEFGQQALAVYQEIGNKVGIGRSLKNIGTFYKGLSNYAQALNFYQQSLVIGQEAGDKVGVGRTLNNLGLLYTAIGENVKALDFYQRALLLRRETKDLSGEAKTLHNIGWAYNQLGEYSKALDFFQQALAIFQKIGERANTAIVLNNIGNVYQEQGKYVKALEVSKQALVIFQELGQQMWIGNTIDTIGSAYKGLNQFEKALDSYQKALGIMRKVGDRQIERLILSNIGEVLAKQNRSEMAIVFYKLSVNVTESIRSDLHSLPTEQQRSYTTTVADTYRHLADLLLQQDRVLEAQQVLDLLKIQEIEDYLRSVRGNEKTAQGIPLTPQEQQIRNRHNEILNREIQLGRKLAELEKIPVANRTPQQQQEIANLRQMQQEMRGRFKEFINSPEIVALIQQLSPAAQTVNLGLLTNIRSDILNRLKKKAVLIQPLILEDRLELVITTAESPPFRRTVTVKKQDLNRSIMEFRMALENPKSDAKTPAKKLYDLLIKPLEHDLTEAQAKSIIYAPDGQLRYIPLAALYDGKQWLGQRFAINNITAMSLTKFTEETAAKPHILAGAFATGRYNFERGATRFAFSGLQFAGLEVENLAAMMSGTTKLIDREFNRATMIPRLPDYTIIHLATHAMFVTGQPEDSFILLGDGDTITMPDIQNLNLLNVDLVVLSACQTGIGGQLGNGEEILGFGYQIQETGAKAAIASLWKVDDGGTQALMIAFYTALQSGNTKKAEALQKAQIALITGDDSVLGRATNLSILARSRSNLRPSVASRLSHPYYWAPFILIGNGL
ncbi:tetratricopeptide repeat protein [Microcoleus sp. Pol11C1]|uniref:CHAT domain-containing protein n=1 Tax=unclassified Microcoleus TaxID=2642155 RepID=UPI002FD4DAC0